MLAINGTRGLQIYLKKSISCAYLRIVYGFPAGPVITGLAFRSVITPLIGADAVKIATRQNVGIPVVS